MRAPLNQRHIDVEAREQLGEFDRDRAAAKNNYRIGEFPECERVVAGQVSHSSQLGQGSPGDNGAGADDEMRSGDCSTIVERDRVSVGKARVGADEFESAAAQLLSPMIGEFLDETVLARHDRAPVKLDFARLHSPDAAVLGEMADFGGVEQRLGRHATAQDAESAHLFAAFNDGGFQSCVRGRARRRITAAAAADHSDIKIEFTHYIKMSHAHKPSNDLSDGPNRTILECASACGGIRLTELLLLLTIHRMSEIIYPRSPRETMCGWMHLPRYIDKVRLQDRKSVV